MNPARGNGAAGRPKRPTMVDVAREAGVALRTVSRVVNDDPTVGPEYVAKVQAAIAELKFRPDERARQLRTGIAGTIGAAVRRIAEVNPELAAIEQTARASGLTLLASSTDFEDDHPAVDCLSMQAEMEGEGQEYENWDSLHMAVYVFGVQSKSMLVRSF